MSGDRSTGRTRNGLGRSRLGGTLIAAVVLATGYGSVSAASPAYGRERRYLDDRSSGEALIRSLYNAINTREYLRAYSYFGDGPDRPSYDDFAKGYANTDKVRLKLGLITGEGAAGSLYTNVPAAIEATTKDGKTVVYSGCYVTRLVQPLIQEIPPFKPRRIETATLVKMSKSFESVTPTCPDG